MPRRPGGRELNESFIADITRMMRDNLRTPGGCVARLAQYSPGGCINLPSPSTHSYNYDGKPK